MIKTIKTGIILVPLLAFATISHASESYQKMHDEHHGAGHNGHGHNGHGHHDESYMGHHNGETAQNAEKHRRHQHDQVNMPGLRGIDTTEVEISDLKNYFHKSHEDQTQR